MTYKLVQGIVLDRLLKPLKAKSKRRRAARVRGAAVQRAGRPRPQEARGLQTPESTNNAPAEAALLGGVFHSVHFWQIALQNIFE